MLFGLKSNEKKEISYINMRKRKAFRQSLCFYFCRIFPIKKNLISVCTFEGRGGFGCNPKYIVQELHGRNPNYKFVWFVNTNVWEKEFPSYIKKVPNTVWGRAFWLSRSKIWIDNYRKPLGTVKRKGQYYVNTWHANMGFKAIGLWRGDAFSKMAYLVSKNDSDMIDDVTVDSDYCEALFIKGLLYNHSYLKVGQARCDILFGDRTKQKDNFRKNKNIPLSAKIVMFAPTFRETSVNGKRGVFSETWSLDFSRMIKCFEKRFGGTWYLCVRVHPQLAESVADYSNDDLADRVINASKDDDMYEILAAMDAFVTDYSSAAFDAGNCHMPVFIYADDIEKYVCARGGLLWFLSNDTEKEVRAFCDDELSFDMVLPFSVSKNNEELEKNILRFDDDVYVSKLKDMEEKSGLIFTGEASKKIADKIISVMEE